MNPTDQRLEWLIKRVERIEERLTWIERLFMNEGRELFSDTAMHIMNWRVNVRFC
jgi:hypothetical protein